MISKIIYKTAFIAWCCLLVVSCKDDEYTVPTAKSGLQNDCIKKTSGPNMVGLDIEFAYAMGIKAGEGKLVSAQAEASVAGANGTYMEHRSFYTNGSGADVGIPVGEPSVTTGAITKVTFNVDTNAATLRYFYRIPPGAMDKEVSFTFTANSSNGQTVSYKMGPYKIGRMERIQSLNVADGGKCYISIEDMAIYTAAEALTIPGKIDLVYLYRTPANATFLHGFVSPAADAVYLPGITLPSGVNRDTKLQKVFNVKDPQLTLVQGNGVYVDDEDFRQLEMAHAPNFAINVKAEAGLWVETADGRYRAFIFINSVDNATKSAVISIKRYRM